jgi:hypothetical protein
MMQIEVYRDQERSLKVYQVSSSSSSSPSEGSSGSESDCDDEPMKTRSSRLLLHNRNAPLPPHLQMYLDDRMLYDRRRLVLLRLTTIIHLHRTINTSITHTHTSTVLHIICCSVLIVYSSLKLNQIAAALHHTMVDYASFVSFIKHTCVIYTSASSSSSC